MWADCNPRWRWLLYGNKNKILFPTKAEKSNWKLKNQSFVSHLRIGSMNIGEPGCLRVAKGRIWRCCNGEVIFLRKTHVQWLIEAPNEADIPYLLDIRRSLNLPQLSPHLRYLRPGYLRIFLSAREIYMTYRGKRTSIGIWVVFPISFTEIHRVVRHYLTSSCVSDADLIWMKWSLRPTKQTRARKFFSYLETNPCIAEGPLG